VREERDEHECRGDLIARERRGTLSASDQIALGAHLDSCASCRLTRDIRADFEAQSAVELGDAARIARLSAAARRWSQRRARPAARTHRLRARLRVVALSAAALLMAGTASATIWWWRAPAPPAVESHPSVARVVRHGAAARARGATSRRGAGAGVDVDVDLDDTNAAPTNDLAASVSVPAPPAPAPAALDVAVPAIQSAAPAGALRPTQRRPSINFASRNLAARHTALRDGGEPASSLLRRAGEARHRGEIERALGLYRRLQRDFDASPEAALSSVLLGGMLLQRGLTDAALEQFDRYLSSQPRGNLVPEALYGRGRALAALGRGRALDEAQTWRRLLNQFPESAYAPHARRRLDELK
jgi:TolA-binding protein